MNDIKMLTEKYQTTRKVEVFRKKTEETRKWIEGLEKMGLIRNRYAGAYECNVCHETMFIYYNLFYDAVNDWRSQHKSTCSQHKIYEGVREMIKQMPTEYIIQKNIKFEGHYRDNKECKVKVVGWGQEKHEKGSCRENYLECDALSLFINKHLIANYFCCVERAKQEVNNLYECVFCHEPWIRGANRGFWRHHESRIGIHPDCEEKRSKETGWDKVEIKCQNCEEKTFYRLGGEYICYNCKEPITPYYPPNFKGNKNGSDGFIDLIKKGLRPTF